MVRKTMMTSLKTVSFLLLALAGGLLAVNPRTNSPNTEGLHHVLVTTPRDNLGHCGGTLISSEWVLTAAYCDQEKLEVILGHHPGLSGTRTEVIDKQFYVDNDTVHNIMMLKIRSSRSSSATLPSTRHCTPPTGVVKFYGWINAGYNFAADRDVPQNLQTGELTVSTCQDVPKREKQPLSVKLQHQYHHLLCATHPPGVNDCELFAGTSLMHGDVLYGVLVNYDILCQKQVEFMDVCAYKDWINDVKRGVMGKFIKKIKSICCSCFGN